MAFRPSAELSTTFISVCLKMPQVCQCCCRLCLRRVIVNSSSRGQHKPSSILLVVGDVSLVVGPHRIGVAVVARQPPDGAHLVIRPHRARGQRGHVAGGRTRGHVRHTRPQRQPGPATRQRLQQAAYTKHLQENKIFLVVQIFYIT